MRVLPTMLAAALLALTARADDLPAINDPATTDHFPGKIIWADLFTSDQAAAVPFYTGLFGWTATTIDRTTVEHGPLYFVVLSNGDRPVAGIAQGPRRLNSTVRGHWVGFVSVDDVTKTLADAVAAGGHVLSPTKDVPNRGSQAMLYDNQGAILGILRSSSGDPGEYRPDPGDFTWAEAFATDTAQASQFYHAVFGYDVTPDSRPGRDGTFILASGGYARASLAPVPPDRPNAHPAWLLFVRVSSIEDTVAKAIKLGGSILVAPKEVTGTSWIAVIADPVGAAIGVVERENPPEAESQPPAATQ